MSGSHSSFRLLSICLASALASGCGHSTDPIGSIASYDLVSYEGKTLPVDTRTLVAIPVQPGGPSYSCSDRLIGMNLQLLAGNSYAERESRLLVCSDGRPDAPSATAVRGTYMSAGGTLELDANLGTGVSERSFGRFSGDSLIVYRREIRQDIGGTTVNEAPLVFRIQR
ncbi:MAG: hypothetical protein M3Z54_03170 [Gemmatimonadota bacterium]|nr:hypothetical protein [Gemmatimonadota bacterium]